MLSTSPTQTLQKLSLISGKSVYSDNYQGPLQLIMAVGHSGWPHHFCLTFLRFSARFCSTHRNGFATALVFCSRIPALSKCCRLTFLGSQYFGSCPPSVCINLLHLRFADRVKPHFVVYIILCLRVGIGLGFKTPFITTFVSSVFKFGLPNLIFMVECFL